MDLAWPILIIAGFLEPCWVYAMGRSDNFRNVKWDVITAAIIILDMALLSIAMKTIGAGFSYAVWTGIGAVVTFLMGVFIYNEKATRVRIFFIFMIIAGIVGLNIAGGA